MPISLGTGLDSGQRRRGPPPVSGAPVLVRPPALAGTGRIGAPLAADPGDWTGAARLDLAWLRDGAPIPGATGSGYVPVAADDRAALACRITAVGAAGRAVAETAAVAAAFPPPRPTGALPDLIFTQGTGFHIMDASPFFSGDALGFSITGDGVSVDPATGLVTISLDALRAGAAIRLVAENSGGRAELGFTLKVTPAEVAPILTRDPSLAGDGLVGSELVLDPGGWAGTPAPELALQWLRDAAPVAGATEARFTPGAAEDGAAIAARVTARNSAGETAAETAPRVIVRPAPTVVAAPADVVLARGARPAEAPMAGAFAGAGLRFAVRGAGATIDAATGVVTIPTGASRAAETVTVTATNSGGAATVAFAVTVLAAPAATGAPKPAVFAQGVTVETIALAGFFTGDALAFALDAGPAGVTIDAASGLVTVPTGAALAGAVVARATNAVGAATLEVAVTVRPPATVAVTAFDAPAKLAEVSFVQRNAVPSWTYDAAAGCAVFTPGKPSDITLGAWAQARGDGRYRALVRIGHNAVPPKTYTRSRPFGLNGRMAREGANMRGVRVELDRLVDGTTSFEIREYTGAAETATLIATAPVAWDYGVWYWMETEFDGPTVRARLYPATETAPAWQATATTTSLGAGFFGPMGQVFNTATFPIIQIQRLEHHPLAATVAAPSLKGTLADVRVSVGAPVSIDVGAVVDGAGLSWSATVDGATPPAGWALSPAGVLSAPTDAAFARRRVAVTATDELGRSATATFAVQVDPAAPRLTGALADVTTTVGAAATVDFGAIVEGTGLVFTADRPWTIDARGVLTVPTTAPLTGAAVTLTATDALARAVSATFRVTVRAPALVLTAPVANVAATIGEVLRVDVGALVTPKAGLTWTSNRPSWGLSAAGVLTIPTTAALAAAAVTVTATDAFGQSVTATFQVTVVAPPMTLTTAPTLAPATAPGTALGSVWNIAGGVYAGGVAPIVTERRFLRDGVQIAAFGAATAYTVVAADQGKTITAQVRRTDSSVPPQVQTVDVAGAAVIPAAVPPMTVTTPPSFAAATPPGTALGSVWNIAGGVYAGGVAPIVTERRFLRDGVQIAAFGAATAYTIVAADRGKTITAQVRRTDSSVPPQVQTVDVAGAAVIPAAVPPMTVTTPPSFAAATPPGTAVGSVWNIAGGAYAGGVAPFTLERRFLRDGAAIGAFGAATAYTIVAADRGKTIAAEVRRTDSSVPPQVLTAAAAGSAVIPAAQPVADYTVNNTAQLLAAMIDAAAFTAPKLIICNPGAYAALTRNAALVKQGFTTVDGRRSNPNNRVTIRALNRSDAAVANQTRFLNNEMTFTGLSGFDFEGVVWERTAKDGVNYGAGDPRNSKIGGMAGFPATGNTCMTMTACDNIRFLNCRFIGGHRTCSWQQANTRITYERCGFEGIGMDGVSMFADDNRFIAFLYNKFREDVDFVRAPSDAPNRHPDSFSVQAPSGQDLSWIGNDIRGGPGYMQGPFMPNAEVRDGAMAWATGKQWRLTVRLNYVECRHTNAYVIGPADGSDISDNVLRTRAVLAGEVEGAGGGTGVPNFNLSGRHANAFCGRNVTPRAVKFINGALASQWTGLNTNVVSGTAWPAAFPNNAPHPAGVYSG